MTNIAGSDAVRPAGRVFPARSIAIFLAVLIVLSAAVDAVLIRAEKIDIYHGFVIHAEMWVPAIASFAACLFARIPLGSLGWRWPSLRWSLLGYGVPILYGLLAYAVLWISGLAPLDMRAFSTALTGLGLGAANIPVAIVLTMTYGVVQSAASAAGEEIGWRGFLVPALAERMAFLPLALVSGGIWAAWHMPLIIYGDYHGEAPLGVMIGAFSVMIVATGAIAAWLRLKSGSVWPAVLLHAAHNAVIQWLLDPITVETGRSAWFAGEFGLVLAGVSLVVATVLIARDPVSAR